MTALPNWSRKSPGDAVEVQPGERILASATTPSGAGVAVTRDALYLPQRNGESHRISWERVETAGWDSPVLEVLEIGASAPHRVLLEDEGRVPEAVRERVTASIVVSERVVLVVGDQPAGARITGRRVSGNDQLHWTVLFDAGIDPSDPTMRVAADRELARMRDWYGA